MNGGGGGTDGGGTTTTTVAPFVFEHVPSLEQSCSDFARSLHMPEECASVFGSDVCLNFTRVDTTNDEFIAMSSYYTEFFHHFPNLGSDTISYELAKAEIYRFCNPRPRHPDDDDEDTHHRRHHQKQSPTLCFKL